MTFLRIKILRKNSSMPKKTAKDGKELEGRVEFLPTILQSLGPCLRFLRTPPCQLQPLNGHLQNHLHPALPVLGRHLLFLWTFASCEMGRSSGHTLCPTPSVSAFYLQHFLTPSSQMSPKDSPVCQEGSGVPVLASQGSARPPGPECGQLPFPPPVPPGCG